jgi:hypothetical protein
MAIKGIGATLGAFGVGILVGTRVKRGYTPISAKRTRGVTSRNTDTAEPTTPAGAVLDDAMSGRNFKGGGRTYEVTPEDPLVSEGNASASQGLHTEKPRSKSKKKMGKRSGAKHVVK